MASHIDQGDLKKKATELTDAVAEGATKAFKATKSGVKTAAPHVMDAVDATVKTATPYVDTAADTAAKLTAKAGEALDTFHADVVNDYLPRLSAALEEAAQKARQEADKAASAVAESAPVAAVEEATTKRKRHRKTGRVIRWTLFAGAAAGAGYLVWRRSQPVEDPWAEEYWADLETDVPVEEVTPEEVAEAQVVADAEEITEESAEDN